MEATEAEARESSRAPRERGSRCWKRRGVWTVCPHPHRGGVWGGNCTPSTEIVSTFELKQESFGAFWDW